MSLHVLNKTVKFLQIFMGQEKFFTFFYHLRDPKLITQFQMEIPFAYIKTSLYSLLWGQKHLFIPYCEVNHLFTSCYKVSVSFKTHYMKNLINRFKTYIIMRLIIPFPSKKWNLHSKFLFESTSKYLSCSLVDNPDVNRSIYIYIYIKIITEPLWTVSSSIITSIDATLTIPLIHFTCRVTVFFANNS